MLEIPVYIATGFLESGKTSFIKEILEDHEFTEGKKVLVICCEEGVEEYEEEVLADGNAVLVMSLIHIWCIIRWPTMRPISASVPPASTMSSCVWARSGWNII